MKCKDCKYWFSWEKHPDRDQLGECEKIDTTGIPSKSWISTDGSEAVLVTQEDFGCVLFKEKQDE